MLWNSSLSRLNEGGSCAIRFKLVSLESKVGVSIPSVDVCILSSTGRFQESRLAKCRPCVRSWVLFSQSPNRFVLSCCSASWAKFSYISLCVLRTILSVTPLHELSFALFEMLEQIGGDVTFCGKCDTFVDSFWEGCSKQNLINISFVIPTLTHNTSCP